MTAAGVVQRLDNSPQLLEREPKLRLQRGLGRTIVIRRQLHQGSEESLTRDIDTRLPQSAPAAFLRELPAKRFVFDA